MYIEAGAMLYGKSLTNHTPGQHVPSFAAQMERLARNGLNAVMVYTSPAQ